MTENEQKMWDVVNVMKDDIKDIKEALLGDGFGNIGYGKRISLLEHGFKDISLKVGNWSVIIKLISFFLLAGGSIIAVIKFIN